MAPSSGRTGEPPRQLFEMKLLDIPRAEMLRRLPLKLSVDFPVLSLTQPIPLSVNILKVINDTHSFQVVLGGLDWK